jgi:hypothetical protein
MWEPGRGQVSITCGFFSDTLGAYYTEGSCSRSFISGDFITKKILHADSHARKTKKEKRKKQRNERLVQR